MLLGHQLVHNHSQSIHFSLFIRYEIFVAQFFQRHILHGALADFRGYVIFGKDGEAEICDLEHSFSDKHVGRLKVLV